VVKSVLERQTSIEALQSDGKALWKRKDMFHDGSDAVSDFRKEVLACSIHWAHYYYYYIIRPIASRAFLYKFSGCMCA
jgi:hypothetical protein